MVSLSKHGGIKPSSFDKFRMSGVVIQQLFIAQFRIYSFEHLLRSLYLVVNFYHIPINNDCQSFIYAVYVIIGKSLLWLV
jgi:hypothetical protein